MEKSKDNKIMKAHFVVSCQDLHNLKRDTQICNHEAMHLVMLTASIMKSWVETLYFTSAFLQGAMLGRGVFLRPLSDVCLESQVRKLKRCIYGLNNAPHSCYKRVYHELTNLMGIVSAYDNALFLWHDTTGVLAIQWKWYISEECDLTIKKSIQSRNTWKWNLQNFGIGC